MDDSKKPQDGPPGRGPKKPYRKPRLETYGELGQITGNSGSKGSVSDGGAMVKFSKTH